MAEMSPPSTAGATAPAPAGEAAPGLAVTLAQGPPLRITRVAHLELLAHAYDGYPLEACALLVGVIGSQLIEAVVPAVNVDASARTYAIGPEAFRLADERHGPAGLDVIGVMHSHTHTDAYPSPTDIDKADNPFLEGWKYVIVSLRDSAPVLRSYLLDGRAVVEEVVAVIDR